MPVSLPDAQLLLQAFEHSATGTVILDARHGDFPIVYANQAFEHLTGYSASELLGQSGRFLQGPDHGQPGALEIQQAVQQGQAVTVTLRTYHRSGTLLYTEVSLNPLRDEAGALTHYVGYQNDVTAREEARQRAAQAHQQLLSTLDRMTDAFVSFDREMN